MSASPGKTVAHRLYVHACALDQLTGELAEAVARAEAAARIQRLEAFNVIRFDPMTG